MSTVQTFLPYADFSMSAHVLDQQRLGKQRVESLQVLQALTGRKLEGTFEMVDTGRKKLEETSSGIWETVPVLKRVDTPESEWYTIEYWPKGWTNHPVARMWQGHLSTLMEYQMAVCREWGAVRGYRDTCLPKSALIMRDSGLDATPPPHWLGDEAFHLSHKRALIFKKPEHYQPIWPDIEGVYDYVWPAASPLLAG